MTKEEELWNEYRKQVLAFGQTPATEKAYMAWRVEFLKGDK